MAVLLLVVHLIFLAVSLFQLGSASASKRMSTTQEDVKKWAKFVRFNLCFSIAWTFMIVADIAQIMKR